jgi:hypothetical protein
MAKNQTLFKGFFSGTESTRGTRVDPTRKMFTDFEFNVERSLEAFANRTGTRFSRRNPSYNRPVYTASGTDELSFEDAPLWGQLLIDGGNNRGASDGGTPTPMYPYTYVPSPSDDPVDSWTVQAGVPDNGYEYAQFMLRSGTITFDPRSNAAWMFAWEGFAISRTPIGATYTGTTPDRSTEKIRAAGTKVYIDDAGGTIGTTQKTGLVKSGSVAITAGRINEDFLEDDQSYTANRVIIGEWTVDGQLVVSFADNTELANYLSESAVLRKIRISRDGSIIHTTVRKNIALDLYGYWSGFTPGDQDGVITATFDVQAFYDATAATDFKLVVKNALATLP